VWVRKATLREALDRRAASSTSALSRIGNRRLGPYEILQASKPATFHSGNTFPSDFLLLRAATGEAAASLPPTPDIDVAAHESLDEEEEAPMPTPTMEQLALFPGVPLEIAAGLLALPPPTPGDATAAERRALLRGSLPASALPAPAQLPEAGAWLFGDAVRKLSETRAACAAVRLLRVRSPARCRPCCSRSVASKSVAPTACSQ